MKTRLKRFLFNKYRLIGILTMVLIFSFTFTSLLSYTVTRNSIDSDSRTKILPLISDNIYSEIQKDLLQPIHNSSIMANDVFLIDWVLAGEQDSDEVTRYLQRIKDRYEYFSAFFISARTNNYYYYEGILKQIRPEDEHDIWYYNFLRLNRDYDLDVDNDEATSGILTIFINHRLEDNAGNFLGVTGVGLQMSEVGETLESYRKQFGHLIYLIDSEGDIQIHPNQELIEKTNIRDLEGLDAISDEILNREVVTQYYEFKTKNGNVNLSARYLPDLDWYLIVEQDQTQALKTAKVSLMGNIGFGILITIMVIGLVVVVVNLYISKLEETASRDELTGLFNRRKMDDQLSREIAFSKRYGDPLSVMILDIDYFKSINDTYGHHSGDHYLVLLANVLQREVRMVDFVGRWGGEEFIVLLPKTSVEQASLLGERLRLAAEQIHVENSQGTISRTISIGISNASSGNMDMDEIIRQADEAMYRAKQEGGNRVFIWG